MNERITPVEKRFSVWEGPDTGEVWPEQFDAITIRQEVARIVTAKEIRRWLDEFFGIPSTRLASHLYGTVVHREANENNGAVLFDTGRAYWHATMLAGWVTGSREYGYTVYDRQEFRENQIANINVGDYLTYFSVARDFVPVEGEILGMMIASCRDKLAEPL